MTQVFESLPPIFMIELKKLNGEHFALNAVLIEQIQSLPDTTITLINGKKVIVKNSLEEVIQLSTQFYQRIGLQQVYRQVGEKEEDE